MVKLVVQQPRHLRSFPTFVLWGGPLLLFPCLPSSSSIFHVRVREIRILQMSTRRSRAEGKRSLREMSDEEEEEDEDTFEEEEEDEEEVALEKKQKGKAMTTSSSSGSGVCQVERCTADMSRAKQYHKRHKVCEIHAKAPHVRISGLYQRFCQQCSRFHELGEFDETKRSCRRRLAGHNERRRRNTSQ